MQSIITATCNTDSKTWSISVPEISHGYHEVHINFISNNEITYFDNLKFGFRIMSGGIILFQEERPHIGRKLENSDSSIVARFGFTAVAGNRYDLYCWAMNKGENMEGSAQFDAGKTARPHASWIWNGEMWVAPVTRPDDGNYYNWNEESLSWIQIADDVMPRDGRPAKFYG